jgi:hypothetical protein
MMSSAFTKKVLTKGKIRVRYSKCAEIAQTNAAEEIKKKIQNMPVFFLFCSMNDILMSYFYKIRPITSKVTCFLDSQSKN